MSILSSYVALSNCSLCILKGEGNVERLRSAYRGRGRSKDGYECLRKEGLVTVLSVKELSTPVRAVYDSGEHFLAFLWTKLFLAWPSYCLYYESYLSILNLFLITSYLSSVTAFKRR